jgi:hypothetical protein
VLEALDFLLLIHFPLPTVKFRGVTHVHLEVFEDLRILGFLNFEEVALPKDCGGGQLNWGLNLGEVRDVTGVFGFKFKFLVALLEDLFLGFGEFVGTALLCGKSKLLFFTLNISLADGLSLLLAAFFLLCLHLSEVLFEKILRNWVAFNLSSHSLWLRDHFGFRLS